MTSNIRIHAPENVGGPASCSNAEMLGSHQDLSPGTGETDHSAGGEADPGRLVQARSASNTDTVNNGESRA